MIKEDLSLTDMTVLAKLRRMFSSEYLTIPSAPTTDTEVFNQYSSDEKDRISELTHSFGGYFDSAPLGMWNMGQDPRNRYGFSVRFKDMPESILDPARIQVQIDTSGSSLIDQFGNSVYSLHIHSKDVNLFDLKNIEIIQPYLFGGNRRKRYTFYRTMFVSLIVDYKRRGKLLELFANLPIFNRLNRFETFLRIKKIVKKITRPSQN